MNSMKRNCAIFAITLKKTLYSFLAGIQLVKSAFKFINRTGKY